MAERTLDGMGATHLLTKFDHLFLMGGLLPHGECPRSDLKFFGVCTFFLKKGQGLNLFWVKK